MTSPDPDKRIVVVTGASRGVGRAAALALAAAGNHVVAIARTQGGLEELDDEIRAAGGSATLVPMSITDSEGIDRLGSALNERYGRVDALFGNAAILGPLSPLPHVSPQKWDEVMAVNVTANFRLLRSLDPLLRQSPAARTLFVSSNAAHSCRAFWGPYSVSKAALEAMVRTYAAEVESFGITANILNPGVLRTRMRAEAMPGEDASTLAPPDSIAPVIVSLLSVEETRTGRIFDVQDGQWKAARRPDVL